MAIIAFGAAASAPALPLNRETCVKELGCSEEITDFVLPVGMTINMNGTAIMHIIGAAFIATCAGLEVTPMNYLTMTLLAIAASMGTPAIPAAGSVMLYAVLTGAGFNTELCTLIYSLVLAMNKPCEMVLTTLNVVGDAATTVIPSPPARRSSTRRSTTADPLPPCHSAPINPSGRSITMDRPDKWRNLYVYLT